MFRSRSRRGFSLLEVMVSVGILVVSLVILLETQSTAVRMTYEAKRMVTATNLAQEKLNEVLLLVEEEGFGEDELEESGDFSEFGDEAMDIEFAGLSDYRYDWTVSEVDIDTLGNLAGMAESLSGDQQQSSQTASSDASQANAGAGLPGLGSLGISGEMLTEMLGRYIREVRVTVWWGTSWKDAEEKGDYVVLTTHVTNPTGQIISGADTTEEADDVGEISGKGGTR